MVLGVVTYGLSPKSSDPLDDRIRNVESALASIRGLQEPLNRVKDDMVATETSIAIINKKYTEAKELEKLTDGQLQALKESIQSEKWWKTAMNSIIGFILEVLPSVIASVIYDRWKQKRALQSGS